MEATDGFGQLKFRLLRALFRYRTGLEGHYWFDVLFSLLR
jgi:hypothetical protein